MTETKANRIDCGETRTQSQLHPSDCRSRLATGLAPVEITIEIQNRPSENIPPTGLVPVGK